MSHKTPVFLLGSLIVLSGCDAGVPNEEAQAKLAQAYAIAISYPDELPTFAVENAQFFSEDGPSIMVGRAVVRKLRTAALQGPSPDEIRERAYSAAQRAGRPDLAQGVADDMTSQRGELLQLASFLEQLVEVLPSAASGNPQPYKDTLLYTTMNFVWTSYAQVTRDEDSKPLRDMVLEMNMWYVASFIQATQ